jgi:Flp pilus assembly protein TadG
MRATAERSERSALPRRQRGATLVEFALVLPLLVLLLFGIIEFGRILSAQVIVTYAAENGARYATLGATSTEVTNQVRASCPTLDPARITVGVTNAAGASGTAVSVAVTYSFQLDVQVLASIIHSSTVNLHHTAVMRIE